MKGQNMKPMRYLLTFYVLDKRTNIWHIRREIGNYNDAAALLQLTKGKREFIKLQSIEPWWKDFK